VNQAALHGLLNTAAMFASDLNRQPDFNLEIIKAGRTCRFAGCHAYASSLASQVAGVGVMLQKL
jgi:hypothetical protein